MPQDNNYGRGGMGCLDSRARRGRLLWAFVHATCTCDSKHVQLAHGGMARALHRDRLMREKLLDGLIYSLVHRHKYGIKGTRSWRCTCVATLALQPVTSRITILTFSKPTKCFLKLILLLDLSFFINIHSKLATSSGAGFFQSVKLHPFPIGKLILTYLL